MQKIILVKPNGNSTYSKVLRELKAIEPPLWLAVLANYYGASNILDAELYNYTEEETVNKILELGADKVIILCTGTHPSAFIQQKETALKLELALSGKMEVENIDSLPVDPTLYESPRFDLLEMEKYRAHNWHTFGHKERSPYGVTYTSLSCPMNCLFCNIHKFYGRPYKERDISSIVKDFEYFKSKGIKHVKLMDELFVFRKDRVIEICKAIEKIEGNFNIWAYARIDIMDEEILRYLKKAGINWLAYGIESGDENIRKSVSKGNFNNDRIKEVIAMTKKARIKVIGNFMFGFWEDNMETMKKTFNLATELKCEFVNFYATSAFPGTSLYEDLKSKEVDLPSKFTEYAQMHEDFKPIPTKYLSGKEVLNFRDHCFISYFTNQEYLEMMRVKFGSLGSKVVENIGLMSCIGLKRKNGL